MFAKLYSLGIDDDTVFNILQQDKLDLRHLISEHQQLCWILKEGPNPFPFRPLHMAALKGNVKVAELLLEKDADADSCFSTCGALECAIMADQAAMVKFFAQHGACLQILRGTPIRFAAIVGSNEIINWIFSTQGANINVPDQYGGGDMHLTYAFI